MSIYANLADDSRFDHIQPAATPAPSDLVHGVRRNYAIDEFPRQLDNKVYLLKHFVQYMLERLFGDQEYTFEDCELKKGMVFVTRYLRMKHVILFRLSNDVLQVGARTGSTDKSSTSSTTPN